MCRGWESQEGYLCRHLGHGSKKGNFKGNVNKGREGKLLLFVLVIYLVPKNETAQALILQKVNSLTYLIACCIDLRCCVDYCDCI